MPEKSRVLEQMGRSLKRKKKQIHWDIVFTSLGSRDRLLVCLKLMCFILKIPGTR